MAGVTDELAFPSDSDVEAFQQLVERVRQPVQLIACAGRIQTLTQIAFADRVDPPAHAIDGPQSAPHHDPDQETEQRTSGDDHHDEDAHESVAHVRDARRRTRHDQRHARIGRCRTHEDPQVAQNRVVRGHDPGGCPAPRPRQRRETLRSGARTHDPAVGREELDVQVGRPLTRG